MITKGSSMYKSIIDGREYTGSGPLDIAEQRYGKGVMIWAEKTLGLFQVIDDDGRTLVARIYVTEIS